MKRIFKYDITSCFSNPEKKLPKGAEILDIQVQNNKLCMWALVDDKNSEETRIFHIFGTGHHVYKDNLKYIGTVQENHEQLVWHIFEEI